MKWSWFPVEAMSVKSSETVKAFQSEQTFASALHSVTLGWRAFLMMIFHSIWWSSCCAMIILSYRIAVERENFKWVTNFDLREVFAGENFGFYGLTFLLNLETFKSCSTFKANLPVTHLYHTYDKLNINHSPNIMDRGRKDSYDCIHYNVVFSNSL